MKTRHCDECKHGQLSWYTYRGGEPFDVMKCANGHKPRFYMPRNQLDLNWGWKRRCGDYQEKFDADQRQTEAFLKNPARFGTSRIAIGDERNAAKRSD
jgi:hypothetical protein